MRFRMYLLEITNLDQTLQELAGALKKKDGKGIKRLSAVAIAQGMVPHDLETFIKNKGDRPKPVRGTPRWGT